MAKDFSSQQVVEGYDQHIRKLIPGYEVVHQQIQALLKTYLPESAHILVVGCGTGYELGYLLQTFPNWHFTATDLSAAMLDKARTSLQDLNVDHRVDFHLGDVHELENIVSFDAALSILVTHFVAFLKS
jgi:tRNA (cmo5U34)-methyltransferase